VAAWAAAILVGTSIPGRALPPAFPHADKLVHLVLYGGLGFLAARAQLLGAVGRRAGRLLAVIAGVALFGAFDEWHQDFIPGRSSDRIDWLADVVGATAGLLVATTTLRSEQRI
jgi:VanZ family protein